MSSRFRDKIALVTGGAGVIGAAIARRLTDEGARVVISDITAPEAIEAAQFVAADVSDAVQVRDLIARVVREHGAIDIVASNAGIARPSPFLELTSEAFTHTIAVNLSGAFYLCQAAAREMVRQVDEGRAPGAIVATSSVAAKLAHPDLIDYSASKGGLSMLIAGMALALAPQGIRVNAVGPGTTLGAARNVGLAEAPRGRALLSRTPLGRFAQADEIAAVVAFLASNDASYITGQTLFADGGRLALNGTMTADT